MNDTQPTEADLREAALLVDRAIRTAVPQAGMVRQKLRPESTVEWFEPGPLPGLTAALAVMRMAEKRAHGYAVHLRGEGTPWTTIADLMGVPYEDERTQAERTFELVTGDDAGIYEPSVSWNCGGPLGCGKAIRDHGPYESHPADNETGHAPDCRRAEAEAEARRLAVEERDRRTRVSKAAYEAVVDPFDRMTVERCWWTLRRCGQIDPRLSTTEQLAVAVVLADDTYLDRTRHTRDEAISRVWNTTPEQMALRLAGMRAAATGEEN